MKYADDSPANIISLAEHLGACISDHDPTTPNKLSEDMVKCMCNIYVTLADPCPENHLWSPTSFLSSLGRYSPKYDPWNTRLRKESSFVVEGFKDFTGSYSSMIEIKQINRDNKRIGDVDCLFENFRSLVYHLETIDPKTMKHEEKLAFWINIHNALVMHSFLTFGIPHNNISRTFQLMKAAYNVGGQVVSVDIIQNSILGCRISRSVQLMRWLLPSKSKFDEKQAYAIHRPEPLVYFALSFGSHSDPPVRVFSSKKVYKELEVAKEDYIQSTFRVGKNKRILVPKMIECYTKDSGLSQDDILRLIHESLPDHLKKLDRRKIEWIPHNFSFRYLIMTDLDK